MFVAGFVVILIAALLLSTPHNTDAFVLFKNTNVDSVCQKDSLLIDRSRLFSSSTGQPPTRTTPSVAAPPITVRTDSIVDDDKDAASPCCCGTEEDVYSPPLPISTPWYTKWLFLWHASVGLHHKYIYNLFTTHGGCFFLGKQVVVLHDTAAIRQVLETHNLEKAPDTRRGFRVLFYNTGGILAAPWKKWIAQRRLTMPAFADTALANFLPRFDTVSRPFLETIETVARSQQVLEMDQCFTGLTLDSISLVVLGRTLGLCSRQLDQLAMNHETAPHPFTVALRQLETQALLQMSVPTPLLQFLPAQRQRDVQTARQVIDDLLEDCIEARKRDANTAAELPNDNTLALVDVLLEAHRDGALTRSALKGQLLTFLYAGHDTTAHTLTWMLFEISNNSTLQDALYEESRMVLPQWDDFVSDLGVLKTNSLPLLDAVWQETLRLYPAAALGTTRYTGKQPVSVTLEDGSQVTLPAKTNVLIPAYSIHRNAKHWPDPMSFDVTRFLDAEQSHSRDTMAFQAFSAGPRNCIGGRLARAEALCILSALVRRYRIQNVEHAVPSQFLSLTLKPRDGIRFTFERREH